MKKTILRKYAALIAQAGVNVQKGQEVFIQAGLDQPEFVQMVVEECYKRKAKRVVVDWDYEPLQKVHTRYQSLTTMSTTVRLCSTCLNLTCMTAIVLVCPTVG